MYILLLFCGLFVSDSLWAHGMQHARLPCPSPPPRACSNSRPLGWWCYPTILSSVIPFTSCLQSFPASGSFPMSQFFPSGDLSIGVSASASVLPMNIEDWFPLGSTGLISLQSKGLWRVFSSTIVQKHQLLWAQPSLRIHKPIHMPSFFQISFPYRSPQSMEQNYLCYTVEFSSVQSLSRVRLFETPWIAAHQASLSITNSWSPPKPMSYELVMPSNHLILCRPILLLPSSFPSIRVFSNESALHIR